MYHVIDTQTGATIKSHSTGRAARAYAHRKDAAYGAVRFVVRFVSTQ
ncbi:MAG: hypothetical protein V4764_02825 [Burkholderia sp.]